DNETQFAIDRCQGTGCTFAQVATVAANATSYSDQSLAASTTYTYQVRALNGTVSSTASNSAQATTQAGQQPPPVVKSHVAAMTGSSAPNGKSSWRATVTITVVDNAGAPLSNATVSGAWTVGSPTSGSCLTTASGSCNVTSAKLTNGTPSATFTVGNITHS